jgi:hypothetical protein
MVPEQLATYLNDHLAGSEVALEMLEHLERGHEGSPIAGFAAALRAEIEEDRRELEGLMERLGITRSPVRQAAAWLSEKLTRVKLKLDDLRGDRFRLLEAFEALSLGIEGKRLLWRSLAAGAETAPGLRGTDYAGLERRAEDQRQQVEGFRLEALKAVLDPAPAAS